jgi:hypothetical protein
VDVTAPHASLSHSPLALTMHRRRDMSCRCHLHANPEKQRRAAPPDPHWRDAKLTLVLGTQAAVVRPAALAARFHGGALCVQLDDLWAASHLGGDLPSLAFDFVGRDGYRPSTRGHPRIAGWLLEHGYLQLETRDLEWEAPFEVECWYRVKGVTTIVADVTRE